MYLSIQRNILQKNLQQLIKVSPIRSTMPILSSVLFQVEGNILKLMASDIEITMATTIEINNGQDGSVTIPAVTILNLVNEINEPEIVISCSENYEVNLKTNNGIFSIMGKPGEEFPSLPSINTTKNIQISNEIFSRMIRKTIFAVGRDELKPALLGVLFEFNPKEIIAVSTDSHRLVCLKRKDYPSGDITEKIIIPSKFLNILLSYLETDKNTTISLSENHVKVELENTVIFSRLIDENFPNYEKVIPDENKNIVICDVKELIAVLKRCAILSNKSTKQVSINFDKEGSKIDTIDAERRSSSDEKIFMQYEGESITIGYNAEYLIDILKNIETSNVIIKFNNESGPSIFLSEDQNEDEDLTMLLMPIMLNE